MARISKQGQTRHTNIFTEIQDIKAQTSNFAKYTGLQKAMRASAWRIRAAHTAADHGSIKSRDAVRSNCACAIKLATCGIEIRL